MLLQLNAGETILFQAGQCGLFEKNPPFLQSIFCRYDFAQGTLYLTTSRIVFLGFDINRHARIAGERLRVYNRQLGPHNFEASLSNIKEIKACKICGAWPVGIEVTLSDGSCIYFSLFGRKKLIQAFYEHR